MPLMALDTRFTTEVTVVAERRLLPLLFPSLDARKGVKEDQGLGMLSKAFEPGCLALHPFMRYPEPYAVRNATRPQKWTVRCRGLHDDLRRDGASGGLFMLRFIAH